MDTYLMYENGSIQCTFATVKGLCFYWFFAAYTRWLTLDEPQIPESEHATIEQLFAENLSFLTNIKNDNHDRLNFNTFYTQLQTIVSTINDLKQ